MRDDDTTEGVDTGVNHRGEFCVIWEGGGNLRSFFDFLSNRVPALLCQLTEDSSEVVAIERSFHVLQQPSDLDLLEQEELSQLQGLSVGTFLAKGVKKLDRSVKVLNQARKGSSVLLQPRLGLLTKELSDLVQGLNPHLFQTKGFLRNLNFLLSNCGELSTPCRVPKCKLTPLLPVEPYCFFTHQVNVSVVKHYRVVFSHRLSVVVPIKV